MQKNNVISIDTTSVNDFAVFKKLDFIRLDVGDVFSR